MNYFAVFLLCTVAIPLVLSGPARQTREPKHDDDFEESSGTGSSEESARFEGPEDFEERHGKRHHGGFRHQSEKPELGRHEERDGFRRHEHRDRQREEEFFRSTPNGKDGAVEAITVTYVGYNTTSAASEATEESTTAAEGEGTTATMEPAKSAGESENSVTEETDNESSLVDLDLALLKNSEINKIIKNQLSSAAKQSGLIGAIETAPDVAGATGLGSLTGGLGGLSGLTGGLSGLTGGLSGLTGGLGGLTGGLGGLTGGLGLPSLPGVGGVGDLTNNAQSVAENNSQTIKKLLEIDLNGKSLIGI